jgi:hypothetical protein
MNNREVWTARRWAPQRVLIFFGTWSNQKASRRVRNLIVSNKAEAAALLALGRGINYARPSRFTNGLLMNAFTFL